MGNDEPCSDDAVLGGGQPPSTGVVLGGLEGCKRRIAAAEEAVPWFDIFDASRYGEEGRQFAIAVFRQVFVDVIALDAVFFWVLGWEEEYKSLFLEAFQSLSDSERCQIYSRENDVTGAQIKKITKQGRSTKFKDYKNIRVGGKDCFSKLKHDKLSELVGDEISTEINIELGEHNQLVRATAMRWHLRGLPVWQAIRKVKTDLEISENAAKARYRT